MSPKRRRISQAQQRRQRERFKGLLYIGITVTAVFVFATVYYMVKSEQRVLDPETLCSDKPTSLTVLLVDVTDPMNTPQRQDFINQLTRLKNSISRYGELAIMRVDQSGDQLLSPVITRCSPGTASDTDEKQGNPQKLQRQWETGFSAPLDQAFLEISRASGADKSPIMESVQAAALTELQKPGRDGITKRLIIASDLLQNTDDISFYGALPAAQNFTNSEVFQRVRTDLRGVEVELWQLKRPDSSKTQPRALSRLWESAIAAQGGEVVRIYDVSG